MKKPFAKKELKNQATRPSFPDLTQVTQQQAEAILTDFRKQFIFSELELDEAARTKQWNETAPLLIEPYAPNLMGLYNALEQRASLADDKEISASCKYLLAHAEAVLNDALDYKDATHTSAMSAAFCLKRSIREQFKPAPDLEKRDIARD